MTDSPEKPKLFSMIRSFHLADWFTLGNAVCGVGSLFATINYIQDHGAEHVYYACALVLAAFVFDVLDGRVARWRHASSPLGRELDSLADVISFGVAPAVIAYGCGMQGLWDRIVLGYFVACGVSRLARCCSARLRNCPQSSLAAAWQWASSSGASKRARLSSSWSLIQR